MSLLSVKDVVVRFGGVTALDHVGFDLNRGEILGLIGPNGAGKTTLFNCISGVINPDEGTMHYDGRPLGGLKPHERAQIGIARTFQNLQLWPSMTVLENLKLPIDALSRRNIVADALRLPVAVYQEKRATEYARATLHALELLAYQDVLAGDLPVGIQRRVEVARALCLRPQLLLLDEPAAGLDADETLHFADLLQRVRERFKTSVLLVDHDMSLVMRACDYIYVLDFGRLLASGKPEEVRNNPQVIAAYLGEAKEKLEVESPDATDVEGLTPVAAAPAKAKPATTEFEPLLEVTGLAAGYGHLEVIRDVNLRVGKGEVVACIGANGAGKTTTLRALSGIIRATRGKITFDGHDITRSAAQDIVRLGLLHVPQGRGLFQKLTVEDTLRLASYSGHRNGDLKPAYDTFPVLGKRRRQLAGSLSGGEQQMLAIARALLVRPKLLMIDEMSQGLAPTIVQRLFSYVEVFQAEGTAVLLVEQFVDSALAIADRAYVFEQGTIAHEESAARLRQDQSLIASSYLGTAAAKEPAAGVTADGHLSFDLMEELTLRLPAALMRALQEQAAKQGREPEELLREFLQGQEVEA
ncbi:MAG TPA: ATP-binding cassette domain-containing protein [Candidatus Dormibacteraeota bacterium]